MLTCLSNTFLLWCAPSTCPRFVHEAYVSNDGGVRTAHRTATVSWQPGSSQFVIVNNVMSEAVNKLMMMMCYMLAACCDNMSE